jgi:hypothetical protein
MLVVLWLLKVVETRQRKATSMSDFFLEEKLGAHVLFTK